MESYVIKRDGQRELVSFDKILRRIAALADGLPHVNPVRISQSVIAALRDGIRTSELDERASEVCAMFATDEAEYGLLAARIRVSNLHKETTDSFSAAFAALPEGMPLNPALQEFIAANAGAIDAHIIHNRDFNFDYMGIGTLMKQGYLLPGFRPQYLYMTVALALWAPDLEAAFKVYDDMSTWKYTHATPTLFNSHLKSPQLASCYLASSADDVSDMYDAVKECAKISKNGGGIGLSVGMIRARDSLIRGTGGRSSGVIGYLKTVEATMCHINQGGKRQGSCAAYLPWWHADIEEFLRLRDPATEEHRRALDLFTAVWVNDLFWRRWALDEDVSLFCPNDVFGLLDLSGASFEERYLAAEAAGLARAKLPAKKLMTWIAESQIKSGTPYVLNADHCNLKNMQANLGTLRISNLCVAPETTVFVREGHVPIASLEGKTLDVWNGDEWSETTIVKTGVAQKLITVTLNSGQSLTCTPYHKFILHAEGADIRNAPRVPAADLKPGMCLFEGYGWPSLEYYDVDDSIDGPLIVESVADLGRVDDTYCFNEPKNHAGVFNGILAGNCVEVMEYTDDKETAVCNLASVSLPTFVLQEKKAYDFEGLAATVRQLVRNLNRVIDISSYPDAKTRRSNLRHRPMGIGIQGLADVFALLGLDFDSPEAARLNRKIAEVMYFAAVDESATLAQAKDGPGPYESFPGSPYESGLLQFDLWKSPPRETCDLDWAGLKEKVKKGMRNSLLIALMPTATTAQIIGNTESFEAVHSNMFTRKVLSGEYIVVNKHMMRDLKAAGVWSPAVAEAIRENGGSLQGIAAIPAALQKRYRTVWELTNRVYQELAAARGPFVCQSQSMNLYLPSDKLHPERIANMLYNSWRLGLKTGMYYLRQQKIKKLFSAGAAAGAGAECSMCTA